MQWAQQICIDNKARLTAQREHVLRLILDSSKPITAYELLDKLRQSQANAQPPTVYRALDFLLEHKLIHKLRTINAFYSCICPGDKHAVLFLICDNCSESTEIVEPNLMGQLHQRITKSGYVSDFPLLEVLSTCPSCAAA